MGGKGPVLSLAAHMAADQPRMLIVHEQTGALVWDVRWARMATAGQRPPPASVLPRAPPAVVLPLSGADSIHTALFSHQTSCVLCCVGLCACHTSGDSCAAVPSSQAALCMPPCPAGTRQWWCALTMETPLRRKMGRRHQPLSPAALRLLARPPLRAGLGGMATALPPGTRLATCLCGDCPNLARQVGRLGQGDASLVAGITCSSAACLTGCSHGR